jgi:ABC-2 type transport system ATP-binding protein
VQHFGMVMGQKSQLLWDIPAIDTLHIIRELYQIPKQVFKQNLDEFMSLLSVSHLLKTPVRNLSLGERMKFELIVSMIHQPKLLFLDEPTIGLDIVSQKAIRDFLQEINLKHKTTIIITSHYMRDIEVLAKRVLIIKRGSIFYDSSLKDLLKNFGDSRKIYFTTEKTEFNLSMPFEKISQIEYSINCIPLDLQKNILEIVNQIPITSVRTEETSLEEAIFSIFDERKGF